MRRWASAPCEVCKKPGVLRLRWCSLACAARVAIRFCAVTDCLKLPEDADKYICNEHRAYPVASAAVRVLIEHPGADLAARFVDIDTRLSVVIYRLRERGATSPAWINRLTYWTFPLVNLRFETVQAVRTMSERASGLLDEFEKGVREVEGKYRAAVG